MEIFYNYSQQKQNFIEQHPNVKIISLLKAFLKCQQRKADDIREASNHVYQGIGCPACQKRLSRWET